MKEPEQLPPENELEVTVNQPSKRKIGLVDRGGAITYSLVVGGAINYGSGLDLTGIAIARGTATAVNWYAGKWYGKWREHVFRKTNTDENSRWYRKVGVDFLAFLPFQVPILAATTALASLVSDGYVDFEKVEKSMYLGVAISPVVSLTMNGYMDLFRGWFGVKSAAEGAYKEE